MTSSRECFCGCDAEIASANQLAGNLLGWDITLDFGQWMQILAVLEISSLGREYGDEPFIADGRSMWLSLREQVHDGLPQTRADRRTTKRWLKFSKKERKNLSRKLAGGGIVNPFDDVNFGAEEVRAWILWREWPAWTAFPVDEEGERPTF